MCGMPRDLSRTIVTSLRGWTVLATSSGLTPNDESSKYGARPASVMPCEFQTRSWYGFTVSLKCAGRTPNALKARRSVKVALPFCPGGRMSRHCSRQ